MKVAMRRILFPLLVGSSLLAWPAVGGPAEHASKAGAADRAVVPLVPSGTFYTVEAELVGQGPFELLVDVGTNVAVLDSSVAEQLSLQGTGRSDGSAEQDPRTFHLARLAIGTVELEDVEVAVRDLDEVWGSRSFDGVIGLSVFGDRLVTIDSSARQLVVAEGTLPAANGKDIISYTLEPRDDDLGIRHVPAISVEVAGKSMTVDLDPLGFGPLTLPESRRADVALTSEPGMVGRSVTSDGEFDILGSSLDGSIVIGRHEIAGPGVFLSGSFHHAAIGSRALGRLRVTFDQTNRRVRVEKPSGAADPLLAAAASLEPQSGDGPALKTLFNKDAGKTRLIVLLSPT